ncbi:MAG: DUF2752 domain-containing protein [Micromonosporaceae bacterium]
MADTTTYPYQAPAAAPVKPQRRWPRRLTPLSILPVAAAAIAYILAFNPTDKVTDPTGPCAWHMLFGIDGPGCGGTRMAWYLLHGDLIEAARHHLVAFIAVPFVVYAYIQWLANWTFGIKLPVFRPSLRLVIGYIVAFLLYSTVLRNLPFPPFDWFYVENLT